MNTQDTVHITSHLWRCRVSPPDRTPPPCTRGCCPPRWPPPWWSPPSRRARPRTPGPTRRWGCTLRGRVRCRAKFNSARRRTLRSEMALRRQEKPWEDPKKIQEGPRIPEKAPRRPEREIFFFLFLTFRIHKKLLPLCLSGSEAAW